MLLGWTTLTSINNGATKGTTDYRFIYTEELAHPCYGNSLVFKGNTVHLRKKAFKTLMIARTLEISGNTFHLMHESTPENFFPAEMVKRLGGTWKERTPEMPPDAKPVYIEPEGDAGREPVINDNKFIRINDLGPRTPWHVDVKRLSELTIAPDENDDSFEKAVIREEAAIRPKDPARNLNAALAGPASVKLTWDGSKDPKVIGYRVFYGAKPNSIALSKVVDNQTSIEIGDLGPGTWYFSVAAHKDAFVECWTLSNEAMVELK